MGNDGILECFAFNVMISGIELNQYDYGVYQEQILMLRTKMVPQEVRFNTPNQVLNSKCTFEGSTRDHFMPSKPHVPNFSPLGFMGLVHESCLERF